MADWSLKDFILAYLPEITKWFWRYIVPSALTAWIGKRWREWPWPIFIAIFVILYAAGVIISGNGINYSGFGNTKISSCPPLAPTTKLDVPTHVTHTAPWITYKSFITTKFAILPIERKGMNRGSEHTKTGSVHITDPNLNDGNIKFGDNARNEEFRGFLSFNISKIPQDASIRSACLYLSKQEKGGFDHDYFNTILLETINIGDGIKNNFNSNSILKEKTIPYKSFLNNNPIDVTNEVNKIRELGQSIITLRFRFYSSSDNNNETDMIEINNECCGTILYVEFKSN